jgi:hypothetical protein
MTPVLMQILSLTGAILVLIGFGGQQYAGMKSDGMTYGLLNFVGSLLLASSAIAPLNAGVLVLEGTWALISLNVMIRSTRAVHRD